MTNKFLANLKAVFLSTDLRKKILFIIFVLVVFRIAAHIPVPGVDVEALKNSFGSNQLLSFLNLFSGGSMQRMSIVMAGVYPYITAIIIMQLLAMVSPKLEAIQKDGERGKQQINRYARYLTVPLAALESYGLFSLLKRTDASIFPSTTPFDIFVIILTVTAGTIFLMWLGELITERGVGNGISLLIFAGIVAGAPLAAKSALDWIDSPQKVTQVLLFLIAAILVIASIVFVDRALRNIPIQYARKIRGSRLSGAVSTYLPIKVNTAGVIPIIFAISFVMFPGIIGNFFSNATTPWLAEFAKNLQVWFSPTSYVYGAVYFLMVFAFTYFYTGVVFKPKEVSENLQKQGAFIPGVRPGEETEKFLSFIISRITFVGAVFLGLVAVLPFIVQKFYSAIPLTIGGTAILIVVSVVLETLRQIKAQIVMRTYDKY